MADSDIYAALISGTPTDAAKQAALADMLRRRAAFGTVAQLSGDQTLAPFGAAQEQSAQQQAQAMGRSTQAQQAAQFQQQQEARIAANAQAQMELERNAQALTRRGQNLNYAADIARAEAAAGKGTTKPPTEGQLSARGYLSRMQKAEGLLGNYTPDTTDFYAAQKLYGSESPLAATLANKVLSKGGQNYYQAAADWVRAKLRKESGATISPAEMVSEIRTYFPVPGDSAETIAQKTNARAAAVEEMRTMGGQEAPTEAATPPKRRKYNPQTGKIE